MILLSSNIREKHMIPLSIMNMEVKRNANGSQIDSFSDYIDIKIHDIKQIVELEYVFAPLIILAKLCFSNLKLT